AVPLAGENRVFAKLGLAGLRSPVNEGLKALLEVAQLGGARAKTAGEVAFRIAPRLNAAGRMDVAPDLNHLVGVKESARARAPAARRFIYWMRSSPAALSLLATEDMLMP